MPLLVQHPPVSPHVSQATDEMADWNIYTNKELGFNFLYPQHLSMKKQAVETGTIDRFTFTPPGRSLPVFTFSIYKDSPVYGKTIEEHIEKYQKHTLNKEGPAVTLQIEGKNINNEIDGTQITFGGVDVGKEVVFNNNGDIYEFYFHLMTMTNEEQAQYEQVLDRILSTIQFDQ